MKAKLKIFTLSFLIFLAFWQGCTSNEDSQDIQPKGPVDGIYLPDTIYGIEYKTAFDSTLCFEMFDDFRSPIANYAIAGSNGFGYLRRISDWYIIDHDIYIETMSLPISELFRQISYHEDFEMTILPDSASENILIIDDGFLIDELQFYQEDSPVQLTLNSRILMNPFGELAFTITENKLDYIFSGFNSSMDNISYIRLITNEANEDSFTIDAFSLTKKIVLDSIGLVPIIAKAELDFQIYLCYSAESAGTLEIAFASERNLQAGIRYSMERWHSAFNHFPEFNTQPIRWNKAGDMDFEIAFIPRYKLSIDGMEVSNMALKSTYHLDASEGLSYWQYVLSNQLSQQFSMERDMLPVNLEKSIDSSKTSIDTLIKRRSGEELPDLSIEIQSHEDSSIVENRIVQISGEILNYEGSIIDIENGTIKAKAYVDALSGEFYGDIFLQKGMNEIIVSASQFGEYRSDTIYIMGDFDDDSLQILLFWQVPSCDLDLYISEPDGQIVHKGHTESTNGGVLFSEDSNGFGPESYIISESPISGDYSIDIHFNDANGWANTVEYVAYILKNGEIYNQYDGYFTVGSDNSEKSGADFIDSGDNSWEHIGTISIP